MPLVIRFSERPSQFETTRQRLRDIAEFLGVSQNKAAAHAINQLWDHLNRRQDMQGELEKSRSETASA